MWEKNDLVREDSLNRSSERFRWHRYFWEGRSAKSTFPTSKKAFFSFAQFFDEVVMSLLNSLAYLQYAQKENCLA